jgi:vesicle coat complex subunit
MCTTMALSIPEELITRCVQMVSSVQTEMIIVCISSFFSLLNYEPNQTFQNINRINRNIFWFIQLNQNYII